MTSFRLSFFAATLFFALPAFHCHALDGPPSLPGSTTKSIAVPIARMLVVDVFMHAGLVALWPDDFGPGCGSAAQFKSNFRNPPYANMRKPFFSLDEDPFAINGILHPIYGSEAWIAARDNGRSGLWAFLFAVSASLTWEYLIEGPYQPPSLIDMLWTPFAGAALGEVRFQLIRKVSQRVNRRGARILFMTLLDPLGQVERAMYGEKL